MAGAPPLPAALVDRIIRLALAGDAPRAYTVGEADLINARHSGRIADEIDPRFARHEVDDGLVLRCERFDVSFAVIVRFSEGVLCVFGREQGACLGERDPSSLIRWQCRQGVSKRGLSCSVELHGIRRSDSVPPE